MPENVLPPIMYGGEQLYPSRGAYRKIRPNPVTGKFELEYRKEYHDVNDHERANYDAEKLVKTRVLAHVKLGYVGQILVKGAIAYETTEPFENMSDALDAVNKRVAEKLAGLFAD